MNSIHTWHLNLTDHDHFKQKIFLSIVTYVMHVAGRSFSSYSGCFSLDKKQC